MPLQSLRVLDLTRLLPGPYCSMFFADFGADVIKVEEPNLGDYMRWREPYINDNGAVFHSLNRNKRSVTLNLKSEDGKVIFKKLVETADIVIESFRPGVMKRLGLNYEVLKDVNPGLIYCAITGYGQDGPYADKAGHDLNYLSYAGLLGLQGRENEAPVLSAAQIADIGGGSQMATIGILIALQYRNQTGKGQFLDISMTDGVISWMQTVLPGYLVDHKVPEKGRIKLGGGNAHYNVYETIDNRYVSVGANEEKFWREFCTVIGCPHLIGRLNSPYEEQQDMIKEISSVIKKKSLNEWMDAFKEKDCCVSPVLNLDEVVKNPQVVHRGIFTKNEQSPYGQSYVQNPIKMSETPSTIRNGAPNIGEHNREVFGELGFSKSDLDNWEKDGII